MSIDYQANITGFEALFDRMDKLREEIGPAKTDRIWRNVMLYAMEPVLQDAKTFAPKRTNQLADHIYMKAHRPQMRDKASITYQGESYLARVTSSPIRDDSVLETILNKKGKFQSYWTKKRPVGISNEFGNKRTPKHQFLQPALNNNIDRIQRRLGEALMVQINKIGEGKA
jgi:hypothetical protein